MQAEQRSDGGRDDETAAGPGAGAGPGTGPGAPYGSPGGPSEPPPPHGPYGPGDTERWVPEPDKRPGRTAFQRDRARVLHSAALRRLAGKTQVVDPDGPGAGASGAGGAGGIPRTRLTHSLECAQVGRELGAALGCDPDLVETACLAHDLGHPPFGHTGETVLAEVSRDIGGFEGNAQSLRLLTRLEPKRFTEGGIPVGVNLTRASLDAATKYPWARGGQPPGADPRKFGVYEDDLPVFGWLRAGTPPGAEHARCFEAQVMDWSDDVAYSVHDLEDGLHAGHLDPNLLLAEPERRDVFALSADRYAPPGTDPDELAEALDRLLDAEWWPHGYDGTAAAQARLKDATSQLIGRFCLAAERATRAAHGPGPLTRYRADLVVPRAQRLECAVLKAVADRYVMQRPAQERRRAEQRAIVAELVAELTARAPEGLSPLGRGLFLGAPDEGARRRAVIDDVASLTDTGATALHRAFCGGR
jgi:dGTPase